MEGRTQGHDGRFGSPSADEALAQKQAELTARGDAGSNGRNPMSPQDLHPLFAAYVEDIRLRGRDHKTVARAFYALRRLEGWLEDVGVDPRDVDEHRLKQYAAWLRFTVANTSAKSETEKVKAAYRYAVRIGLIEKNPAEYVETPALEDREPETYTNDELRRIRAVLMTDLEELIFYLLVYTGCRRFELSQLRWEDVDFELGMMKILGKGRKLRRVPIHPRLAEVLVQRKRKVGGEFVIGEGGSTRNFNTRLKKLLERAGVDGGNRPAHRFRATVQCALYEEGVREDVIDRILGWAPRTIRQRYYSRVRDEVAHEAILKLYASDPIERPPLRVIDGEADVELEAAV
jgi:integrase